MHCGRTLTPPTPRSRPSLIAYPIGKLFALVLPVSVYTVPAWLPFAGGATFSLNPSPFNIKEHGLITMMISVSNVAAYALMAAIASATYYNVDFPVGCVAASARGLAPPFVELRRLTAFPCALASPGSRSCSSCRHSSRA